MKRMISIGLSFAFILSLALPALSQGGENNAWQSIQEERDARRRAEKLASFINEYPNSSQRPNADKMLVSFYNDNKDFAKIMGHADSFRLTQSSADNASKSEIFTQAMLAAASLNNMNKIVEFSEYALIADPNNLTVLILLAGSNIPNPEKAMEYAKTAASVPKPVNIADAQWQRMQGQIHSILGTFYMSKNQFKEADSEFALALQANPRDHVTYYRSGFVSLNLMGASAQAAQAANAELVEASTAKASASTITELTTKQETHEKEALERRDVAIELMAKAVALGGQFAEEAKKLLDTIYMNKHKSLDGEDALIAAKKAEFGL